MAERVYGYERREPYPGEADYFKANPHVGGMAAEDNRIVLNPHSKLSPQEQQAVARNEATRLYLREQKWPLDFELTPEQRASFQGTPYGDPAHADDLKQTLLARLVSGDPSAGTPTARQQEWANWLKGTLEGRNVSEGTDWMAAFDRLKQGMLNPEGQTIREMRWSDYPSGQETPEAFWSRGKYKDVEAVPFGSLADPVSQLAFLLAPEILPALKGLRASGPMPRGSVLGNQRGVVGGTGGEVPRWKPGDMSRAQWEQEMTEQHLDAMEMGTGSKGQHDWTPGGLRQGKDFYAADAPKRLEVQQERESLAPPELFRSRTSRPAPGSPEFLEELHTRLYMKNSRTPQEEAMFQRLKAWREAREQARRLKYGY